MQHLQLCLLEIMEAEGLRRTDLATLAGVTRGRVTDVLNTRRPTVNARTIARLAYAAGYRIVPTIQKL